MARHDINYSSDICRRTVDTCNPEMYMFAVYCSNDLNITIIISVGWIDVKLSFRPPAKNWQV